MEVVKTYQIEKYEFTSNDDKVSSATIESIYPKEPIVTIFGYDGNIILESSLSLVKEEEYSEWLKPYISLLKL